MSSNNPLKDLAEATSAAIPKKNANKPLELDKDKYPYFVAPATNKFGFVNCAFCGRPPTEMGDNRAPRAHLFVDELSAKEYLISGICQECQDETFKPHPEDEDSEEAEGPYEPDESDKHTSDSHSLDLDGESF